LINGNRLRFSFEVSVNIEGAFVDLAKPEIRDCANTDGVSIYFFKLMALKKMPRNLMALYKTSDMLLTAEFSESSVTCVEFSKRVATDELSDDLFL
jgi:hypothetical protein